MGGETPVDGTSRRASTENPTFGTSASRIERSLAVVVGAASDANLLRKSALARFAREWVQLGVGPDDSGEAVVIATASLLVRSLPATDKAIGMRRPCVASWPL